ncbi:paraquat-inducible protein A [Endozoicomonas sp. OPT23]|uniref:paraquat-inducible protein A n=1 Tax=Endozoicomonas sp. OPT23 TaxID=2072845 RepID=UPI00189177D4|nr:paraquat-inducible protein A [Endozoicomonas sp. OPT23]
MKNSSLVSLRLCRDCDLLVRIPSFENHPGWKQQAVCPRCGCCLELHQPSSVLICLALVLTGLLLFLPANMLPVLSMEIMGNVQQSTVLEGAIALHSEGLEAVAWLVIATAIVIPLFRLLILFQVLLSVITASMHQTAARMFRWYAHLGEWGMMEIYVLGVLISVIKLADMASVNVGYGLYCFAGLMLVELVISIYLNPHALWEQLERLS